MDTNTDVGSQSGFNVTRNMTSNPFQVTQGDQFELAVNQASRQSLAEAVVDAPPRVTQHNTPNGSFMLAVQVVRRASLNSTTVLAAGGSSATLPSQVGEIAGHLTTDGSLVVLSVLTQLASRFVELPPTSKDSSSQVPQRVIATQPVAVDMSTWIPGQIPIPIRIKNLSVPIRINLSIIEPDPPRPGMELRCVAWNEQLQRWTEEGMSMGVQALGSNGSSVQCLSTHLTIFSAIWHDLLLVLVCTPLRIFTGDGVQLLFWMHPDSGVILNEAVFATLLYYALFLGSSVIAIMTGIGSYRNLTQRRVADQWFLLSNEFDESKAPAMRQRQLQSAELAEWQSRLAEQTKRDSVFKIRSLRAVSDKSKSWMRPRMVLKMIRMKISSHVIITAGAAHAQLSKHDIPLMMSNVTEEAVENALCFKAQADTDDMEAVGFSVWSFRRFVRETFCGQVYLLVLMNHPLLELRRPPLDVPLIVLCVSSLCRIWGTLLLFIVFHNALGQATSKNAPPACGKAATPVTRIVLTTVCSSFFTTIIVGKCFAFSQRQFKDARLWSRTKQRQQIIRWHLSDRILSVLGLAFSSYAILYLGLFLVQVKVQDRQLLAASMLVFLMKRYFIIPLTTALALSLMVQAMSPRRKKSGVNQSDSSCDSQGTTSEWSCNTDLGTISTWSINSYLDARRTEVVELGISPISTQQNLKSSSDDGVCISNGNNMDRECFAINQFSKVSNDVAEERANEMDAQDKELEEKSSRRLCAQNSREKDEKRDKKDDEKKDDEKKKDEKKEGEKQEDEKKEDEEKDEKEEGEDEKKDALHEQPYESQPRAAQHLPPESLHQIPDVQSSKWASKSQDHPNREAPVSALQAEAALALLSPGRRHFGVDNHLHKQMASALRAEAVTAMLSPGRGHLGVGNQLRKHRENHGQRADRPLPQQAPAELRDPTAKLSLADLTQHQVREPLRLLGNSVTKLTSPELLTTASDYRTLSRSAESDCRALSRSSAQSNVPPVQLLPQTSLGPADFIPADSSLWKKRSLQMRPKGSSRSCLKQACEQAKKQIQDRR